MDTAAQIRAWTSQCMPGESMKRVTGFPAITRRARLPELHRRPGQIRENNLNICRHSVREAETTVDEQAKSFVRWRDGCADHCRAAWLPQSIACDPARAYAPAPRRRDSGNAGARSTCAPAHQQVFACTDAGAPPGRHCRTRRTPVAFRLVPLPPGVGETLARRIGVP